MSEVITVVTSAEVENDFSRQANFEAESVEERAAMLDSVLTSLVSANADVMVSCPWLGGNDVTLGDAMRAYPRPMIDEDPYVLASIVQDMLANKVTDNLEEEKNEVTDDIEEEGINQAQDETEIKELKKVEPKQPESNIKLDSKPEDKPGVRQDRADSKDFNDKPKVAESMPSVKTEQTDEEIVEVKNADQPTNEKVDYEKPVLDSVLNETRVELNELKKIIEQRTEIQTPFPEEAEVFEAEDPIAESIEDVASANIELAEEIVDIEQPLEFAEEIASLREPDEAALETEVAEFEINSSVEEAAIVLVDEVEIYPEEEMLKGDNHVENVLSIEIVEEIKDSLVELSERLEEAEPEVSEAVELVLEKISGIISEVEPQSPEDRRGEIEVQEELKELFIELFETLGIEYSPEIIDSLVNMTLKLHFVDLLKENKDEEKANNLVNDGTHEVIKRLLARSNTLQRAMRQASLIGKSVLQLYTNAALVDRWVNG